MLDEEQHNICAAIPRCQPQCIVGTSVHMSPVLEEELHHLRVTRS